MIRIQPSQRFIVFLGMIAIACTLMVTQASAQDTVYLIKKAGRSNFKGKITKTTPLNVVIGSETIPADNIRKITYGSASASFNRAADRADDGRFEDCLAELKKIKEAPKSKFIAAEIAYLQAYSTAQVSLNGGEVTALAAGSAVTNFVKNHPDSYHLYPTIELKGKLLNAIGKPQLAAKEFDRLTKSGWPKYDAIGHFYVGETQLLSNQFDAAAASFSALANVNANDPGTMELKLIGNCQRAKALGLKGQTDQAIGVIQKVILEEDPTNIRLFAYAYNAMGACQLKKGNLKEAALAYLHTDLLFQDPEPHAESLYHLSKIWPKLEMTTRANEAQEKLRTRYRNSLWSTKK